MAAAWYENNVQRMQSYAAPTTGNLLGGNAPLSTARMGSSYQLPTTQLNSIAPPTSLNAGGNLLSNGGGLYQLPSTGALGNMGLNNQISGFGQQSSYSVNQEVEIYSESCKGWVPGYIKDIDNKGRASVSYSGAMKIVPVEYQHTHLRPRMSPLGNGAQGGGAQNFQFFASPGAKMDVTIPRVCAVDGLYPGADVEYFSTTHGGWVRTKIANVRPNGNYDLECKSDVPQDKIRPVDALQSGITLCDNAPPKRVAPSYGNLGPPPPEQVGTFQFDLAALCGVAPPRTQTGFDNYGAPPYDNHEPQNYGAPQICPNEEPSFFIDLAQAVKEVEEGMHQGDHCGNGPRRIETEYLPENYGNGPRRIETEYLPW